MSEQGQNFRLTDDHLKALAYHHKGQYESALAKKKTADANLKNTAKKAKAEGVSLDTIKDLILLDTPEGEAAMKIELQRKIQVAGWANSEIGVQFSFDDIPDRAPLTERAYEEGKTAGLKGDTAITPYEGEAGQEWLRGHAAGQAILMETLDLTAQGMRSIKAEEAAIAKAEKKAAKEAEKLAKKQAKSAEPKRPRGRPKKAKANGTEHVDSDQADVEDATGEEQSEDHGETASAVGG